MLFMMGRKMDCSFSPSSSSAATLDAIDMSRSLATVLSSFTELFHPASACLSSVKVVRTNSVSTRMFHDENFSFLVVAPSVLLHVSRGGTSPSAVPTLHAQNGHHRDLIASIRCRREG